MKGLSQISRKREKGNVPKGEIYVKNKKMIIVIAVFLLAITVIFLLKDKILRIIYPQNYKEIVNIYAEEYGVDENLIFAVIKAESNFDENAVSHKNAIGLMQIMEETAEDIVTRYGIDIDKDNFNEEIKKVENNINIGTKYLSTLLETYGNKEIAVAAYNAGIGTVNNWIEKGIIRNDGTDIENIPYKETNNYVRKILRNYEIYQRIYK